MNVRLILATLFVVFAALLVGCGGNKDTYVPGLSTNGGGEPVTPDFTLQVTPGSITVPRGTPAVYEVRVVSSAGFSSPVDLSLLYSDFDLDASYAQQTLTPTPEGATTTLTVTAPTFQETSEEKTRATSTVPLRITASGGGKSHTVTVNIVVEDPILD